MMVLTVFSTFSIASICSVRYIQKGKGLCQWVNANTGNVPSCTKNLNGSRMGVELTVGWEW